MNRKLLLCTLVAFFSFINLYAVDELQSEIKNLNNTIDKAGIIDYTKNCSTYIKEAKQKLGKLVSEYNKQTIELSVVTEEELTKVFDELANNKDIPFGYAYDGCYARAHKMSQIMESKGIITGKAFVEGNLNVVSPILEAVNWWYHVAPVVLVKKDGKEIPYVIDPSLFKKPVPFDEWRDSMTQAHAENLDHQYFTNRFSYTPNDKTPPPKTAFTPSDLASTQSTMEDYRSKLSEILKNKTAKEY